MVIHIIVRWLLVIRTLNDGQPIHTSFSGLEGGRVVFAVGWLHLGVVPYSGCLDAERHVWLWKILWFLVESRDLIHSGVIAIAVYSDALSWVVVAIADCRRLFWMPYILFGTHARPSTRISSTSSTCCSSAKNSAQLTSLIVSLALAALKAISTT